MAFRSIQTKTFLLLLGMTLSMALVLVLTISLSFDRGFSRYKKNIYDELNQQVVDQLARFYQQHGAWNRIKIERGLWHQILISSLIEQADQDNVRRRPVNRKHFKYHTLLTADKTRVIGHPLHRHPKMTDLPIKVNSQLVGYLRVPDSTRFINKIDRSFNRTMQQWFYVLLVVALVLTLLLSWPISGYFTRPIRRLNQHVKTLSDGQYGGHINFRRQDELGRLAQNLSQLSQTLKANQTSQNQLFTDISHELRTPVAVLRAQIEAMQDGIKNCDVEQLNTLHQQVMTLSLLIQDIQDLAGSEMGSLQYRKNPVNISALLRTVLADFSEQLNTHQLQLSTDIKPEVFIHGDDLRLRQLFANLIKNSCQYTKPPGQLQVQLKQKGHSVVIWLQDSPPSVDKRFQGDIFKRLFRIDQDRNKQQGGFGIGLALASNIVKAHNGTIRATDSDLGGLAIEIVLPVNRDNQSHD